MSKIIQRWIKYETKVGDSMQRSLEEWLSLIHDIFKNPVNQLYISKELANDISLSAAEYLHELKSSKGEVGPGKVD